MDARSYFLTVYRHAHGDAAYPTSPAYGFLNRVPPEQWRVKFPGQNSIAWNIWHIARGEDWAVNGMLRGEEQVLIRDGWPARLGLERLDWGFGMSEDDVAALSEEVNLDGLRAYFDAVTAETLHFVETFDFDTLHAPLDVEAGLTRTQANLGPTPDALRRIVERNATNRWYLNVMTISDVMLHWGEAVHVYWTMRREARSG